MLVYIPLEPYLAQWFIHHHGGMSPVQLRRGSSDSDILEVFLTRRPADAVPERDTSGMVPVIIPSFRFKPAEYYNYLPPAAVDAFVRNVRTQFDVEMWSDLYRFGHIGKRKDHLIYAWMESHGIEATETNWNAIAKRYQRKRKWTIENRRKGKNSL